MMGNDEWGASWIAAAPRTPGCRRRVGARSHRMDQRARERCALTAPSSPGSTCPSSRPARACACRPGSPSSTPPAGTASRSTPPAVATARARSARCRCSRATCRCGRLDSRAFDPDQLADGWRLACIANATCDLRDPRSAAHDPPEGGNRGRRAAGHPAAVASSEAAHHDDRADAGRPAHRRRAASGRDHRPRPRTSTRTCCATSPGSCGPPTSTSPPSSSTTMLVAIEPGDTTERLYGIAFDLGTTTVVATLLDLSTGTPIAVASMLNKQQPFGADVISRISATMLDPNALEQLQLLAHETLSELAAEVCEEGGVDPAEVYEVALAGNATMTQIALGIDPEPLGVAPFILATESLPHDAGQRARLRAQPPRPRVPLPGPGGLRRRRHHRRRPGHRDGPRQAAPPVHRHRHQLRDRPGRRRAPPGHGGPGGAGLRGRVDPVRHAGGRGRRSRS